MITSEHYQIGKHILTWDWDKHESNVARQPINNLYIDGLWNMKDTIHRDELCTGCKVIDDETFSFTTFICQCYTMKIINHTVEPVSCVCTK